MASALRWIKEAGSQAGVAAPVVQHRRMREPVAWGAAVAALALGVGMGWVWKSASEEPSRVVRSSLLPPEGARFEPSFGAMALSPEGTRVAFVASDDDGTPLLWVRSLDALTAQPLADTEDAAYPFWSPDGRFLGFFSNGKLRRIDASGGPPQTLCEARRGHGGTWSPNGTILFAPNITDVIYKVSASGGTPVPVTTFDESRGEKAHLFPQFLPDGHRFLFLAYAADRTPDTDGGLAVFAASLDSTEKTPIVATRWPARYAASGHLLFVRDRTLVARPFDPGTLELTGDAVPVAEDIATAAYSKRSLASRTRGSFCFRPRPARGIRALSGLTAPVGSWVRSEDPPSTMPVPLFPTTRSGSQSRLATPRRSKTTSGSSTPSETPEPA